MSLIKFPTQIKPDQVTIELARVDEILGSPATNIQQVAFRGNPAWRWIYQFKDLSEDERDIVQAFIFNCKGSINEFKVQDSGNYQIKGTGSDWLDIFSNAGEFFKSSSFRFF